MGVRKYACSDSDAERCIKYKIRKEYDIINIANDLNRFGSKMLAQSFDGANNWLGLEAALFWALQGQSFNNNAASAVARGAAVAMTVADRQQHLLLRNIRCSNNQWLLCNSNNSCSKVMGLQWTRLVRHRCRWIQWIMNRRLKSQQRKHRQQQHNRRQQRWELLQQRQ